jgi:MoaA/NifB/PqqE/SkfB family radical SAM enzyme
LSSIQLAGRLFSSWLEPATPAYLVYFVTAACNAKCEMCFYWQEIESAKTRKELTPEETAKIAEHLPRLIQLTLSGGEPFLRDDLFDLVRPLIEKPRPVFLSIPTNGTLTDRIVETVSRLTASFPWLRISIELSVEGVGETHDRILSRPGAFQDLLKTWSGLKAIRPRFPNLRLGVLTVFSALSQSEIFDTLKYIKSEMKPDRVEILFARGVPRNPAAGKISIEKFKEAADWLAKESPRPEGFMDRLRDELAREKRSLIIEAVSKNMMITPCLAGKKLIVMEPDGRIRPCEMLDTMAGKESHISDLKSQREAKKFEEGKKRKEKATDNTWLGSLRESDYDLSKILASEQAKRVLNLIDKSSCHCSYECAALADLVFSPSSMLKIFLKSLI